MSAMAAPVPVSPAPAKWFAGAPAPAAGSHLAYSHAVSLEVSADALPAHFAAARDRCLATPALHCVLLEAEIDAPAPARPGVVVERRASASLRVRLPHDQVAGYANALTQALPGEAAGLVHVIRQSTSAIDLGAPVADVAQRVAQLQDYLASLKALGNRLTISVSDLVKIAGETAQAQTQIEQVQAEQRSLAQQVETEALDVSFQSEPPAPPPPVDPVARTMADNAAVFRANLADALGFGVAAAPWVPVGLAGLIVLWIVSRVVVRRPRERVPPSI